MHDPDDKLTDLQYGVRCGLTLENLAARTGTTPTSVRAELAATPIPAWVTATGGTRRESP